MKGLYACLSNGDDDVRFSAVQRTIPQVEPILDRPCIGPAGAGQGITIGVTGVCTFLSGAFSPRYSIILLCLRIRLQVRKARLPSRIPSQEWPDSCRMRWHLHQGPVGRHDPP